MFKGNTEVSRILLSCNNIKIDIKNIHGSTALHLACHFNRIESVKLFLEHPTCNKDIVRIKNKLWMTAEMIADMNGNKECAKLVREYLEDNDDGKNLGTVEDVRSVDDLVKFITGEETEQKKTMKKKKSPAQSATWPDITGHSGGELSYMADDPEILISRHEYIPLTPLRNIYL